MNRILDLQSLSIKPVDQDGASSSSDHNCACSTASAAACFVGDDIIAI